MNISSIISILSSFREGHTLDATDMVVVDSIMDVLENLNNEG